MKTIRLFAVTISLFFTAMTQASFVESFWNSMTYDYSTSNKRQAFVVEENYSPSVHRITAIAQVWCLGDSWTEVEAESDGYAFYLITSQGSSYPDSYNWFVEGEATATTETTYTGDDDEDIVAMDAGATLGYWWSIGVDSDSAYLSAGASSNGTGEVTDSVDYFYGGNDVFNNGDYLKVYGSVGASGLLEGNFLGASTGTGQVILSAAVEE